MRENIPGYAEEIAREQLIRCAAFASDNSGRSINERICGIEVMPFAPVHHARLQIAGSPFLFEITKEQLLRSPNLLRHIRVFFWSIHPSYALPGIVSKIRQTFVFRRINKLDVENAVSECFSYVEESFWDCEPGENRKSLYSHYASMINLFGSVYGWTLKEIMATPYKQLFQLSKAIEHCKGGTPINRSDEVRRRFRAEQNSKELALKA